MVFVSDSAGLVMDEGHVPLGSQPSTTLWGETSRRGWNQWTVSKQHEAIQIEETV